MKIEHVHYQPFPVTILAALQMALPHEVLAIATSLIIACPAKRVKLDTVIKQPIAIANDVKSIVDTAAVSVTNVHPLNSYEILHKPPSTCDSYY